MSDINTRKPDISGKTIQNTADRRFDPRQAGQLPVHTVQNICKHQQQDTANIINQIIMIKKETDCL